MGGTGWDGRLESPERRLGHHPVMGCGGSRARRDARTLAAPPRAARWGRAGEAWEVFGTWSGEAGVPTSPTRWPLPRASRPDPGAKQAKVRDAPPPREWPPLRLGGDDVFWFNKNCAEIDE